MKWIGRFFFDRYPETDKQKEFKKIFWIFQNISEGGFIDISTINWRGLKVNEMIKYFYKINIFFLFISLRSKLMKNHQHHLANALKSIIAVKTLMFQKSLQYALFMLKAFEFRQTIYVWLKFRVHIFLWIKSRSGIVRLNDYRKHR